MHKTTLTLTAAALIAALLPVSAFAAGRYDRSSDDQPRYMRAAYAGEPTDQARRAYAAAPVYAASPFPSDPWLYPIGGAVVGAIIGAAVCPPCTIAGSALTSGGGALVGAGIGAVGGTVIGVAVSQPRVDYATVSGR